LREDTQQWWADTLARDPARLEEGDEPATADAQGLRRFLEGEVLPWFEARKKELANRPLIREQAFGESLDPGKLERLGRYEVHLDRKFERTLAMLLRASKTCGRARSRADPFRKTDGGGLMHAPGGLLSAMRRARFMDQLLQPSRRDLPNIRSAPLAGYAESQSPSG
jgi:hypothetical protein